MADGGGVFHAPRFGAADADWAWQTWGANCGPGAVAAVFHLTLDEVRPHFDAVGFPAKRYTSPSMMNAVLRGLARPWRKCAAAWPVWGLVRVQWEGPWTRPGVPYRVRYRHTHWIGAAISYGGRGVFDINCINNGSGWVSFADWRDVVVPWLLGETEPKASGAWHVTHAIEVEALGKKLSAISGQPSAGGEEQAESCRLKADG